MSAQRQNSMLTWEGNQILGAANISEKLTVRKLRRLIHRSHALTPWTHYEQKSLPFEKVQHKVTTLDAQPSDPSMSNMIVSVTGLLLVRSHTCPLPDHRANFTPVQLRWTTISILCSSVRSSSSCPREGASTCKFNRVVLASSRCSRSHSFNDIFRLSYGA